MSMSKALLVSALLGSALFARAQDPVKAAAFLVSESGTRTVVISEPFLIDPKASNDEVVLQFAQTSNIEAGKTRWSVVRHVDMSTAQRERSNMENKYKAKGLMVEPVK